jgi:hypothetical protein
MFLLTLHLEEGISGRSCVGKEGWREEAQICGRAGAPRGVAVTESKRRKSERRLIDAWQLR